mmetsp:Transcript_133879/g.427900  ORF Transcript_133879/g.427900 Transcript_133879/m.427900 type:complete len:124 (+) Transcript_133879:1013-1384(+)
MRPRRSGGSRGCSFCSEQFCDKAKGLCEFIRVALSEGFGEFDSLACDSCAFNEKIGCAPCTRWHESLSDRIPSFREPQQLSEHNKKAWMRLRFLMSAVAGLNGLSLGCISLATAGECTPARSP